MKLHRSFAILSVVLLSPVLSLAQGGMISTIAGCWGCTTSSAEGVPATSAAFTNTTGIARDASGNTYIADMPQAKVRRIDIATGTIHTIAGTGVHGYSGDGGPATNAQFLGPNSIFTDAAGNLFIADSMYLRKVNTVGIITTVAGGGSYSITEGMMATNAMLWNVTSVYVDGAGNIYTNGNLNTVIKINGSTGTMTTFAGGGGFTDNGDGGPATSAGISGPVEDITGDALGNIYLVSSAGKVRKVNGSSHIISTVAGGGSCTNDWVPATSAPLGIYGCAVDSAGNIIISDRPRGRIRMVDAATGLIHTIAGGGTSTPDGVPALNAALNPYKVSVNRNSQHLYVTDNGYHAYQLTYSPAAFSGWHRDSFNTNVVQQCYSAQFTVFAYRFFTGLTVKTWFGDGQSDVTPFSAACSGIGGVAVLNHNYANSGTYTIKQVLYGGAIAIDSLEQSYQHTLCNDMFVGFYYDRNANCVKDSSDRLIYDVTKTEVDSSGFPLDTISASNGFYYHGNGVAGDIYQFKAISILPPLRAACPTSGVLLDTVQAGVFNTKTHLLGMDCVSSAIIDLSEQAVIPVTGIRDQWGNIYIRNLSCVPTAADVTLRFSPKYVASIGYTHPAATSISGNSITWHIPDISAADQLPTDLYYAIWRNPLYTLADGDTVMSEVTVTPLVGDANGSNNTEVIIDTVRASCDPNEIHVTPAGCIPGNGSPHQLKYDIHFVNTGHDTAFNIHVMDTLSDYLDPSTMNLISATSEMHITKFKAAGHNILKFDFPHINLLDSSHHDACSGAVSYTINTQPGLATSAVVQNRAGIYFDYNDVVMTNTATNLVGCPERVNSVDAQQQVRIFPNPASDNLTVQLSNSSYYRNCVVTNSLGQQLIKQTLNSSSTTIDIATLPPGVYYVVLHGEQGTTTKKFVK